LSYSSSSSSSSAVAAGEAAAAGHNTLSASAASSDTWRIDMQCAFPGPTATRCCFVLQTVKRSLCFRCLKWILAHPPAGRHEAERVSEPSRQRRVHETWARENTLPPRRNPAINNVGVEPNAHALRMRCACAERSVADNRLLQCALVTCERRRRSLFVLFLFSLPVVTSRRVYCTSGNVGISTTES